MKGCVSPWRAERSLSSEPSWLWPGQKATEGYCPAPSLETLPSQLGNLKPGALGIRESAGCSASQPNWGPGSPQRGGLVYCPRLPTIAPLGFDVFCASFPWDY